jgi:aryl-alcohol dehydrogenase-like predicted oxidoreductase
VNIGYMAYSPVSLARVARLWAAAREKGISTAGLALAWLLAHPAVIAPIVSPSTGTQWQTVREAAGADIDEDVSPAVPAMFS